MTVCALHVFVPVDNSVIFGEAWSTLDIFQGDIFVSRLDGCDDSSSCVIYIVAIDRHRFLTYQIARGINTFLWRKIDFFLKHFRSNILRKEEKLEKSRSFFFMDVIDVSFFVFPEAFWDGPRMLETAGKMVGT